MPKHVKMMMLETCPHCKNAFRMMEELKAKHPQYNEVEIEVIEEQKEEEKTKGYDYWYVPTFFVDNVKIHEGVPTLDKIEQVFIEALK
ncbi:MAG: thioredoxin family protein [Erysipelotrichaceae bacterium]